MMKVTQLVADEEGKAHMKITRTPAVLVFLFLANLTIGSAVETKPWPAEAWPSAKTFSHLDPHFGNNMSGACYNPETRTFWVCRNGRPSAFWALKEDGSGNLSIATNEAGTLAKYNSSGDLEGICQADYKKDLVYLMVERLDKIREYDVSDYGKAILKNEWDVSAHVPRRKANLGSEGITFVPDRWLKKAGFTDGDGKPYSSKGGMGGLMFVAHQDGGGIYVFDLDVGKTTSHFVGVYQSSRKESCGLEFDRSTGLLYIWHNIGNNFLEVTKLSSYKDGKDRRFVTMVELIGPKKGNLEGIAISPAGAGKKKQQVLFTDDNNQDGAALMWFRQFDLSSSMKKVNAEQENAPNNKRSINES